MYLPRAELWPWCFVTASRCAVAAAVHALSPARMQWQYTGHVQSKQSQRCCLESVGQYARMHHRQSHPVQLLCDAVASHCLQTEDENGPDNQLINSVYLDNSSMELYHGRLDKKPNALAIRIRSSLPSPPLQTTCRLCNSPCEPLLDTSCKSPCEALCKSCLQSLPADHPVFRSAIGCEPPFQSRFNTILYISAQTIL